MFLTRPNCPRFSTRATSMCQCGESHQPAGRATSQSGGCGGCFRDSPRVQKPHQEPATEAAAGAGGGGAGGEERRKGKASWLLSGLIQ